MTLSFEERATHYASVVRAIDPSPVVFDINEMERVLPALIDVRMRTGRLAIAPFVEPPRSALVEAIGDSLVASYPKADERMLALGALSNGSLVLRGTPIGQVVAHDPRAVAEFAQAMTLADVLVAPSRAAAVSFETMTGVHAIATTLLEPPPLLASSDRPQQSTRGTIVIWECSGRALLRDWFLFALRTCAMPVVVAGPGEESVLASARVVVITEATSPLEAWRLAWCGAALVVDRASGAHEWLSGVVTFDRADVRAIGCAVRAALGSAPPTRRPRALPEHSPMHARAPQTARVALIVRTKNRPTLLARTLQSIEAQTYPHTTAIVVNDGGESVATLVARFPRARLIERAQSEYRSAANVGLRAASDATFVAKVDDDDALAPTHVSALVDALERSGADLAVGGAINVFVRAPDDPQITGYAVVGIVPLERSAMLVRNDILGALRVLVRRTALDSVGGFNADLPVAADFEMWLRLSAASNFVRVSAANAAYTIFADGSSRSQIDDDSQVQALRTIYALHPLGARPRVLDARAAFLAGLERTRKIAVAPPLRSLAVSRPLVLPATHG